MLKRRLIVSVVLLALAIVGCTRDIAAPPVPAGHHSSSDCYGLTNQVPVPGGPALRECNPGYDYSGPPPIQYEYDAPASDATNWDPNETDATNSLFWPGIINIHIDIPGFICSGHGYNQGWNHYDVIIACIDLDGYSDGIMVFGDYDMTWEQRGWLALFGAGHIDNINVTYAHWFAM